MSKCQRFVPPVGLVRFVFALRRGLAWLHRKLVPPHVAALELIGGMWAFRVAYVLTELGVFDALNNGAKSVQELSICCGVTADRLRRLLRAGTEVGVVRERPVDRFENTPLAQALCREGRLSVADYVLFQGRQGWPHWEDLERAVREGQTATEIQHGMKPFDYLDSHPDAAAAFDQGMAALSRVMADAVIGARDFGQACCVVDVGGGQGELLARVLDCAPKAQGILFDLPRVVARAEAFLKTAGVGDRCRCVAGSFFDEGAIPAGDLYLMHGVLHDWDDASATILLRRVRAAMAAKARLLVCEMPLPEPERPHFAHLVDLEMMLQSGGQERTRGEYAALLEAAGFDVVRVLPTAALGVVFEAAPATSPGVSVYRP